MRMRKLEKKLVKASNMDSPKKEKGKDMSNIDKEVETSQINVSIISKKSKNLQTEDMSGLVKSEQNMPTLKS